MAAQRLRRQQREHSGFMVVGLASASRIERAVVLVILVSTPGHAS
jgi:hypothetical protein